MTALPSLTSPTEGAFCSLHPDRPAVATCTRCGSFLCEGDQRVLLDKPYCAACAVLPEVDHLEATRLRYWGKRDTWTWLVGIGALVNLFGAVAYVTGHRPLVACSILILSVLGGCFFFGLRWARIGYFAVALLFSAVSWLSAGAVEGTSDFQQGAVTGRIVGFLVLLLVVVAIYMDTRNRLFFRIDVPREKLAKLWDTYRNNPIARAGYILSLLGIFVPGMGLVTLPLCIVGLKRVAPAAHPPIGRKKQAIAGIVLSVLELIGWATFLTYSWGT